MTNKLRIMKLILSIFAVFVFFSLLGQGFDEEYSYSLLWSDNFTEFRELTDEAPNKRTYKRSKEQKIVTMNNQDTVIINYYWNNRSVLYSDDRVPSWVLDSIITDYYCCACANSAKEYYTSNSGIYEKNYIQTGKNEWLDSRSISWSSSPGGANKRYALKKLKIIKNEDPNHCITFKRTIAVLSAEEYKSLKKN